MLGFLPIMVATIIFNTGKLTANTAPVTDCNIHTQNAQLKCISTSDVDCAMCLRYSRVSAQREYCICAHESC